MLIPLLLLSGAVLIALLASAVEVAVFSLSDARLIRLGESETRIDRALVALRNEPARSLATLWALRVAATALAGAAAWQGLTGVGDPEFLAPALALGAAVLVLVVGELLARIVTPARPEALARSAAVPLRTLSRILAVPLLPVEALARYLTRERGAAVPQITDREIRALVSRGNGEPVIEEHERRLIQRAFLLDQTTAYDVMTPRVDMFAWPETRALADVAPELRSVRYSRIPLYADSMDRITGILYIRDAYQALISGQRDVELRELSREPLFVPGSVTLDGLLVDFQSRRLHMGIVIDEYGGTDGLITLEDILEELVGEIIDETDLAEDRIVRLGRNEILVDGSADLREINHFFNTTFPQLEHRSLNGYLLEILGRVPEPGEKITREGVVIEVVRATDTQVLRARLKHAPGRTVREPRPDRPAEALEAGEPPSSETSRSGGQQAAHEGGSD